MLAGQPPFDGDSPLAIAVQQVKDKATPLHTLRRDAPEELCRIIHGMMNKRPEDRPADAKQLLKELLNVNVDFDTDWEKILDRLGITKPTILWIVRYPWFVWNRHATSRSEPCRPANGDEC